MIGDDLSTPLARAISGDERAFEQVYRDVHPGLLRYLRVAAGEEAEDVAADVWLEVARAIRTFSGDEGRFRAWVFTIGRQRAIDHGRRQVRRPADLVADVPDRPSADDTARAVLDSVGTEEALAVVRRLPKDQAEAVMLRVVAGFDVADVARILGKRPGAVRVNTMRGLRALAELVPRPPDRTYRPPDRLEDEEITPVPVTERSRGVTQHDR